MAPSVELPRDELAVPSNDGLRSNDWGRLRQSLPAKAPANFGQTDSLRVDEPQSPLDLVPENPIFCHQVFVPKQEFLVHRAGDVRQQSIPIHRAESTRATVFAQPSGRPVNPRKFGPAISLAQGPKQDQSARRKVPQGGIAETLEGRREERHRRAQNSRPIVNRTLRGSLRRTRR